MLNLFNSLYDSCLSLVYPQACSICGDGVEYRGDIPACGSCWIDTHIFRGEETICWRCGVEIRGVNSFSSKESINCHRCDQEAYDMVRSVGRYEGALRASILALKHEPFISNRLLNLMVETWQREPISTSTLIVPVPLHPKREKRRGFNQSYILAKALAKRIRIPIETSTLVRTKHTEEHRAGMDLKARRETVSEAFHVEKPKIVEGEKILLIDDVFTTGATTSACASVLKEAGAEKIFILTIARAG
jgi:ComF family protein